MDLLMAQFLSVKVQSTIAYLIVLRDKIMIITNNTIHSKNGL